MCCCCLLLSLLPGAVPWEQPGKTFLHLARWSLVGPGMLAGRVGLLGCPAMSGVAARGTFKDLLLLLLLVLTGSVELPRWTGMPSCPAAPTTDSA